MMQAGGSSPRSSGRTSSQLRVRRFKVSASTTQLEDAALQGLSASLRNHFLCMRDDEFVAALATELETALRV